MYTIDVIQIYDITMYDIYVIYTYTIYIYIYIRRTRTARSTTPASLVAHCRRGSRTPRMKCPAGLRSAPLFLLYTDCPLSSWTPPSCVSFRCALLRFYPLGVHGRGGGKALVRARALVRADALAPHACARARGLASCDRALARGGGCNASCDRASTGQRATNPPRVGCLWVSLCPMAVCDCRRGARGY